MLRFRQIYVRKGTEWDIGEKKGCRALGRLRENRRWMPGSLCEGEMGMGGDAIRRFCGMRPVVTMVGWGIDGGETPPLLSMPMGGGVEESGST